MLDVRHRDMNESDIQRSIMGHEARNAELLKLISDRGEDLEAVRIIDCHFRSPSEERAGLLASALHLRGLSDIMSGPVEGSDKWSVEGQIHASALAVADPTFTESFVRLAAQSSSEYDGWGTSL